MPDFKVTWRRRVYALPIPSQHKLVILALGEYADWNSHDKAHPGAKRLSADTGASDKTVQRALAQGVERGLLVQTTRGHNTNNGRSIANSYDLRLPQSQEVAGDSLTSRPESTGQPGQVNRSERASQQVTGDRLPTPTSTPTSIYETHKPGAPSLDTSDEARPEVAEALKPSVPAPVSIPGVKPLRVSAPRSSPRVSKASGSQTTSSAVCPLGCGTALPPASNDSAAWVDQHLQDVHPDLWAAHPELHHPSPQVPHGTSGTRSLASASPTPEKSPRSAVGPSGTRQARKEPGE